MGSLSDFKKRHGITDEPVQQAPKPSKTASRPNSLERFKQTHNVMNLDEYEAQQQRQTIQTQKNNIDNALRGAAPFLKTPQTDTEKSFAAIGKAHGAAVWDQHLQTQTALKAGQKAKEDAQAMQPQIDAAKARYDEAKGAQRKDTALEILQKAAASIVGGLTGTPAEITPYENDRQHEVAARRDEVSKLEQKQRDLMFRYYSSLMAAPSFDEDSQFRTSRNGKAVSAMPILDALGQETGRVTYTETGYDDLEYDYINRDPGAMAIAESQDMSSGSTIFGMDKSYLKAMKNDEIAVYNYVYKTQGPEAARSLIELLSSDLTLRQRLSREEYARQFANEHKVISSLGTVATAPLKGFGYIGQTIDYLDDGRIDQNAPYNQYSHTSSAIREQVGSTMGGVGNFLYQTGMSMGDFVASLAASGGNQTLSLILTGTSSASDTVIQAKDRGLSDDQAFALGTVAGAAEIAMEKIGMDALFDTKFLRSKGWRGYLLMNGLAESFEEVGTDGINTLADIIISQDKSLWQEAIDKYREAGMTESQAFGKAVGDKALELFLSAAGGFISGEALGSVGAIKYNMELADMGRKIDAMGLSDQQIRQIIRQELDLPSDSRAYQLALKMLDTLNAGKQVSGSQIAQMLVAGQEYLEAQAGDAEVPEGDGQNEGGAVSPATEGDAPTTPLDPATLMDETIAQLRGAPADPIAAALDTIRSGGTVSNRQASDILANGNAVRSLVQQTGMTLPDTASGKRAAVKEALATLATRHPLAPPPGELSPKVTLRPQARAGEQPPEGRLLASAEGVSPVTITPTVDTAPKISHNNKNETGGTYHADPERTELSGAPEAGLPGGAGEQWLSDLIAEQMRLSGPASGTVGTGAEVVPGSVPEGSGSRDFGVQLRTSPVLRVSDRLQSAQTSRGTNAYSVRDTTALPQVYADALTAGRNSDVKNGWCVTPKTAQDLSSDGIRTIMNDTGTVGAGIAPNGDIVAVFKNKNGGPPRALDTLMPIIIEQGGDRLDCYGEILVSTYENYGFIPVARVEFNSEYANEGWDESKGHPWIYFMIHNGDTAEQVASKIGTYPHMTPEQLEALPTYGKEDYDSAMAYRDSLLPDRSDVTQRSEATTDLPQASSAPPNDAVFLRSASDEGSPRPSTAPLGSPRGGAGTAQAVTEGVSPPPTSVEDAPPVGASIARPTQATPSSDDGGDFPTSPLESSFGPNTVGSAQSAFEYKEKTSGLYGNTYENATSKDVQAIGSEAQSRDPRIGLYAVETEAESLFRAKQRTATEEDIDWEYDDLMDRNDWNGEDNDTAFRILDHLRKSGDMVRFDKLAAKQQKRATSSAQMTQSFAKYTRQTTTATAVEAMGKVNELSEHDIQKRAYKKQGFDQWQQDLKQTILDLANQIDGVTTGDVVSMREVIRALAQFRRTTAWMGYSSKLTKIADSALGTLDFETLKAVANAQLSMIPEDFRRRSVGQIVRTIRIHNMLSSLATVNRNAIGNVSGGLVDGFSDSTVGRGLDVLVSLATGKRTVGNDIIHGKTYLSAATKAAKMAAMCVELDIPMDSESRFSVGYTRTHSPQRGIIGRFLSAYEKVMRHALEVSDQFFEGGSAGAVRKSLEDLGAKSGLTDDEISAVAGKVGKRRTYKDDRKLTRGAKLIKRGLDEFGSDELGLGDLVMPFTGTSSNLGQTAIDYSGAGVFTGLYEIMKLIRDVRRGDYEGGSKTTTHRGQSRTVTLVEAQRQAVTNAARGITGAGLVAAFAAMALTGIIRVHDDEDKDARALDQSQDLSGAQFNVDAMLRAFNGEDTAWQAGDHTVTIDFLEPFNAQMYIGYILSQEETVADMLKAYPGASLEASCDPFWICL